MNNQVCLAVDLGAGSGRVLAGIYDGSTLTLKELNRFPSDHYQAADGWHWDVEKLFGHIKKGVATALAEYGEQVVSLGVDTWGVDYGLIDSRGELLGPPFQYRDSRTNGKMDEAHRLMPRSEIYERSGIQFMFFNTLFQLLAEAKSSARLMEKTEVLLFMPDLINHWLTGKKVVERSIASTSQLLNARTRNWDLELIEAMGLPPDIFGELIDAGTVVGPLQESLQKELGSTQLKVIVPGCHDTASAVAGIPSDEDNPVFLSSGTWSLIGRELKSPVLSRESFEAGFSNEAGVFGTTRFLKNIAGMWLLQECKRAWDAEGGVIGYDELVTLAGKEAPGTAIIDPDAPEFQAPEHMPRAIALYCRETGQAVPETPGRFARVILESLAAKYRSTKEQLEELTGQPIHKIHIVGGGSQNRLLNQLAADATGCKIVAGPVEATSIGNILLQLISLGKLGSLAEGRELVRRSFQTETFEPRVTVS